MKKKKKKKSKKALTKQYQKKPLLYLSLLFLILFLITLGIRNSFMTTKISNLKPTPQTKNNYQILLEEPGLNLKLKEKGYHTVTNKEDWQNLWDKMYPTPAPLPKVDFEKNIIIALFLGQQKTGGYTIEVSEIQEQGNFLIIVITEESPSKDCFTTQAITSPFQIITIPKTKKEIKFVTKKKTFDCR